MPKNDDPNRIDTNSSHMEEWPDEIVNLVSLADEAVSSSDLVKARDYFSQVLKIAPNNQWLILNAGKVDLKLGYLPEALQKFFRASALDPACLESHIHLAIVFLMMNLPIEALKEAHIAKALAPLDPDVVQLMELVLATSKQNSVPFGDDLQIESESQLEEVVKYLIQQGKLESAKEILIKSLKVKPKQVNLLKLLAAVLQSQNNFETSIPILMHVLKLVPGDIETLKMLIQWYESIGYVELSTRLKSQLAEK